MIAICGDVHVGASLNLGHVDPETQINSRLLDYKKTLNGIIDRLQENNVKTIIFTGDIFETKHPTSTQLNIFSEAIRRLNLLGIEIVLVTGNHDRQRKVNATTIDIYDKLGIKNLHLYTDFAIHTTVEGAQVLCMPYKDRRMIGTETSKEAVEVIAEELREFRASVGGPIFVVGHFIMERGFKDGDSNELVLPLKIFEGYEPVIMGHVHEHSVISKDPVAIYTGSMERNTFKETKTQHMTFLLDPKNLTEISAIDNNTRPLAVFEFDFSETEYGAEINNMIKGKIGDDLGGKIIKIEGTIHPDDLNFLNQREIREYILTNGATCPKMNIISIVKRQLRNKNINESSSTVEVFSKWLNLIKEPKAVKEKMYEVGVKIIDEVGPE